jgi:electron transfer flavoprotein alpha subunit
MANILVLLFAESDGSLAKSGLEALGVGKQAADALKGALVAGVVGGKVAEAVAYATGAGATKVLSVEGPDFETPRYSTDAAAAEALVKASGAEVVIVPGTSRANRVLAGVARRTGGQADTHAIQVEAGEGGLKVTRWYYRQRIQAVLSRSKRPWFIAVDPGSQAPVAASKGSASPEAVAVAVTGEMKRTTVTGISAPPAEGQTIRPDADLLFVVGAGWTKKQADGQVHASEASTLILGFLGKSRASLGGSKSVVDMGKEGEPVLPFMTHLHQVGQTGSTPRHARGLATCCHGEEPHVVGWRFINERRAVNLDPGCGWARGKADVLYVADAFQLMAKVNDLLK